VASDNVTAPAQGIMAQARFLGGSLGIASSSAILAVQQKSHLAGVVSLETSAKGISTLNDAQRAAIRQAFADAFTLDMKVAAAIVAVGAVLTLGTYRKRISLQKMREEQLRLEKDRRREAHRGTRKGVS
jgi:hypothetical protein